MHDGSHQSQSSFFWGLCRQYFFSFCLRSFGLLWDCPPHPMPFFFFFFLDFVDLQGILEEWISSAQNERTLVIRWTIPLIWSHSLNVWNSLNKLMFMQRLIGALSSYVSNGKGKFKYFMYSFLSLSVFKRCKRFMLK